VRKRFNRTQLLHFTANLKVELISMEACGGSHFLGRALREQGHEVRLIPAQYVKPSVKTNKNDYIDAEAIAEAVGRPTMRFVRVKSDEQLDLQSLHRVDCVCAPAMNKYARRAQECTMKCSASHGGELMRHQAVAPAMKGRCIEIRP